MASLPTRSLADQAHSGVWEQHKEIIRQLYLVQSRSLKEVMKIMREEHDFDATDKIYKYHFKRWRFRKNMTKDEIHSHEADTASGRAVVLPSSNGRELGSQRLKARIQKASPLASDPLTRTPNIRPPLTPVYVSDQSRISDLYSLGEFPIGIRPVDQAADEADTGGLEHPGDSTRRFSATTTRQRPVSITACLHHTISRDNTAGADHKRCQAMVRLGSRQTKSFGR